MIRYFKHQSRYLATLIGGFVIPLWLFLEFSPYKAPRVSYVLMSVLIISQYAFYKEKDFRAKIKTKVSEILKVEQGRLPSTKEIIKRSDQVVQFRGVSILISSLLILILMFVYNDF